jgi:hypothetical protein
MTASMLNIQYTNWSNTVSFSLCGWGYVFGLSTQYLNNTPSSPLGAHGTTTQIACGDTAPLVTANMDIWCCWVIPSSLQRFGVWIHDPGQFIGIGTGPYYYVMSDVVGPAWQTVYAGPLGDPTIFATWTEVEGSATQYSWTNFPGLTINANPTVGDTTLSINVLINDAASASP